jgi:hypothetical protein
MSHKKIAIALPIEDKLLEPLHHWGQRFDWANIKEVHLVHIVKKNITPLEFGLVEMPDEKAYQDMVPTLQKYLRDEGQKIVPPTINVSLVVVSTRGKHGFSGLFHSSFTDQMVKFSPCDVYVVRPEI